MKQALFIDKNDPSEFWIEDIRGRFRVEREVDKVLSKKLRTRKNCPYKATSLETLVSCTQALISAHYSEKFKVSAPRWLIGGASKIQMAFNLNWSPGGNKNQITEMVLRMEPAASVCETSRLREFQLIKYVEEAIPVPTVYWEDSDAKYFPYPALICGFCQGVTKPTQSTSNVSGLGTNLGSHLRKGLSGEFMSHLATLHNLPIDEPGLSAFDIPSAPQDAARWNVDWWRRVWQEDSNQPVPLMDLAGGWMSANLPDLDKASLIHGDYRTGNFLFDETTSTITAWLDWELGHIGDRHEDLAWAMSRAFGHMDETDTDFLICGLLSENEFITQYKVHSGLSINLETLHFYRILAAYKAIVIVLGAGVRNAMNSKSHQDVLLVWLSGLASVLLDDLRQLMSKVV